MNGQGSVLPAVAGATPVANVNPYGKASKAYIKEASGTERTKFSAVEHPAKVWPNVFSSPRHARPLTCALTIHVQTPFAGCGMLSSDRADRLGSVYLPGQLGPGGRRPHAGGTLYGCVGDPSPFCASDRDVALPRWSLRRLREHVSRSSPARGRLRRACPEPRGKLSNGLAACGRQGGGDKYSPGRTMRIDSVPLFCWGRSPFGSEV